MSDSKPVGSAPAVFAPIRFVMFTAATFVAGAVGRATFDEALELSLVWPIYGVVILWLASGNRTTWPWDAVGMSVAVAASVLTDAASWQETVVATVLAAPMAGLWLVIMRRLAPDLRGAGGTRALSRPSDLSAFLVASLATAVTAALLRGSGLGLVPPAAGLESVLLTAVRNLSWILALGALGLLLLDAGRTSRRRSTASTERRGPISLTLTIEVLLVASATMLVVASAFSPDPTPLSFAMVLSSVWAGFRLPTMAALGLALTLGTTAVLATLGGRGIFVAAGSDFEAAAVAQAFLITLVLTALAISLDVSERRRATERASLAEADAQARARLFAAVIDHLDEGVTVITADDDYSVRNDAARRLTGAGGFLNPVPGDVTQPLMLDADGRQLDVAHMPHSRARAESRTVRELVRVQLPSGSERYLEISSVPVLGIAGDESTVVVNTLRDTTAEHEERDQLVAFAGVVAHDLKNPLTVIGGWTESLQDELQGDGPPDVPAMRSMLTRVLSASEQMRTFIDGLLAITVARDQPLALEELDLSALAEEVAELRRGGDTHARISVQPGMCVTADRFLVRQLLDNLIGNAVKYVAPAVRPSINVEAHEAGDFLEISIVDNGIGIPFESRKRIFDTFVRAHAADYAGTGLGLSICERVVTRHGGEIWVDEATEVGTRVRFTLPRAESGGGVVVD